MSSKRTTVRWVIACGAVLLVVAAGVIGWLYYEREYGAEWSPARVKTSIDEGDRIVAMALRFRRQNGRYPKSLDELVPRYLPEIRPPTAGTRVWYYDSDGDTYVLKFAAEGGKPAHVYRSSFGDWKEER